MDASPLKVDEPKNNKEKEKNFLKIKEEFSVWVDNYLKDFFKNEGKKDANLWHDPVGTKIDDLVGDGHYITTEMKDLTVIFGEKLLSFCKNIIFDENYDEVKVKNFYNNLYSTFFNVSPNIFENLNIDYLSKIIISSRINETYNLRNVVNTSGEMAYDLSFLNSEERTNKLVDDIKKLPNSNKISAIKELTNTAINAYGNGSWAHEVFTGIIKLIQEVKNTEKSPIVSFVLDFELKKILNYSHNLDNFEEVDLIEDYEDDNIFGEVEDINKNIILESDEFFRRNRIVPELDKIYYSGVSKDYGSIIIPGQLIPFALVHNVEKNDGYKSNFSYKEIKGLRLFIEKMQKNTEYNDQSIIDIADIYNFLKNKNIDLTNVTLEMSDDIENILIEKRKEVEDDLNKINQKQNIVFSAIEKENYNKTKELFDFVDKNFNKIFVGELKEYGSQWLNFKKEKYEEGLFDVIDSIYIKNIDYSLIFKMNKKGENFSSSVEQEKRKFFLFDETDEKKLNPSQITALKFKELRDFHKKNWESLETRQYESVANIDLMLSKKILELGTIVKKIDLNKFQNIIQEIVKIDSNKKEILSPIDYDGFTKNKEFNPFGSDDFSHLIKILHTSEIRNYINKRLNIKLEQLYLREQIHFLKFLSGSDESKFNKLEKILKKGESLENMNYLRAFLSMSGDESMGDKILALGEKLPEEIARIIFAKYGEYIDAVDSVEEMIKKEYKLSPSPELIAKTKESLLIRGRDLLLSQNKKLSDGIFSDEKFTQELEKIKVDVDLFKTIFKITKENNPDTVLEDFIGLKPEKINNTSLINDEDILEIKEIITENYASDKELGEYAFDSFKKAIQNNDLTEVNFLRKYKKIIALNRLDIKKDGSLYFGSFNVDPKYCNSKIGDAFFQATIAPKLKEKVVSADCPINQPISAYYIESGFVGNNLHIVGKTSLMVIVSNPKQSYESKKLSKESIIKIANKAESTIKVYFAKSQEELPFADVNQGKILTRYFFDKNTKLWFVAFE